MEKLELTFTFEKSTKNTHRYKEDPDGYDPPAIGTLYVHKSATGQSPPQQLVVTVEALILQRGVSIEEEESGAEP